MNVYQWTTGEIAATPFCSPKQGCNCGNSLGVYWAWDRSLGAWVHYAK